MIYLNAGNIWTQSYLDKVIELNEIHDDIKVASLFGSIARLTPTARAADRLPYLEWAQIDRFVNEARRHGIAIRYTLNASCLGAIQDFKRDWDTKLKSDVQELHNIGVREWTVTSPLLLEVLRGMFPDDFLEVSTIAEISTVEEAQRWKELGADGVNVSTSINRDFGRLQNINRILKVAILANEACLYKCPWRRECYNLSSHDSLRSEELFGFYPFRRCNEVRIRVPVEWLKARMVLPQWMSVYMKRTGIEWFKVAYRTHPEEVAIPILKAYMSGQFDGNLVELWPTIAKLGNTAEPKDTTYILCEGLDGFLDHWMMGNTCEDLACGSECKYCYEYYKRMKRRPCGTTRTILSL